MTFITDIRAWGRKQERHWIPDKLVLVKTGKYSGMTSETGE